MEADSHQRHMIRQSGSGIRPPARACPLSRGIVIGSIQLPGRKIEADSHRRPRITQSGSRIQPPAKASRLASASDNTIVRIWYMATGQSILTLEGHSDKVNSIAWSPDGSRLASASEDKTDLAIGQYAYTLEGHSMAVTSIAWSPDRSRLASASYDSTIRIWDAATRQSVSTLEGHSDGINSIAWSPDGSRLASASYDETVKIWDAATGQRVSTLHITSPRFLQFDKFNFNHLHTSVGTFDIGSIASVTPMPYDSILSPEQYGYGLSHDYSWITYNGVKLLWLPAEYRPKYSSRFAMLATNLAIGCTSGHIIFLALTERSPIIGL
ncbi:hypothetical protein N7527_000102 [Penicillium freii]|nr:hypothetical protein N7527_000102 [Penicillium freii]